MSPDNILVISLVLGCSLLKPRKLNLNNLTFHLPFDKVEYEPEQFPGLIYRLDYPKVVCLIFGSGKMVITGARHKDEILEAVQFIQDELADLLYS